MKLLDCPQIGVRPLQEFVYGGEVRSMPDPKTASDREWADYVFNRDGEPGIKREWWYHAPSGTWFIAERDTVKDEFLSTYLYTAPTKPEESSPKPKIQNPKSNASSEQTNPA
jgi:sarcosine oxidase subunit delta